MNVHWLIPGIYKSSVDLQFASLASIRLRAAVSASYGTEHGIKFSAGDEVAPIADAIIIGKVGGGKNSERADFWIKQLIHEKQRGKYLFLDYTDNHLGMPNSGMYDFYSFAVGMVDHLVTPSQSMKSIVSDFTSKPISVIYDALEVPMIEPEPTGNIIPNILWFGHQSNLSYLIDFLQNQVDSKDTFNLTIFTNHEAAEIIRTHGIPSKSQTKINVSIWSVESMIKAAHTCDACVIPSDVLDIRKSGASSNRLITALSLGLPVAASPLSSYLPYANYFFELGSKPFSSFLTGIDSHRAVVKRAQNDVVPHYSPSIIGAEWTRLIQSITKL